MAIVDTQFGLFVAPLIVESVLRSKGYLEVEVVQMFPREVETQLCLLAIGSIYVLSAGLNKQKRILVKKVYFYFFRIAINPPSRPRIVPNRNPPRTTMLRIEKTIASIPPILSNPGW